MTQTHLGEEFRMTSHFSLGDHLPRLGAAAAPLTERIYASDKPIDIAAARRLILDGVEPIDEMEHLPLAAARDRVLARDVTSPLDLPRFDNSAMDGFAIHPADLRSPGGRFFPLVGSVTAGQGVLPTSLAGSVIRITTGAPMPPGAIAVVPDEMVDLLAPAGIIIRKSVESGANVRRRGEDVAAGDLLARTGTRLSPRHLALLAAAGVCTVAVRRKVRVAVLSIGDEIADGDQPAGINGIVDVNRPMLISMLAQAGAEIIDGGAVRDTVGDIVDAIAALPACDLLVTSGGVAGSERDLTLDAFALAGGRIARLELALKPGKSLAIGRAPGPRSLHLPGNPVAALVNAQLFALPLIAALAGAPQRATAQAVAAGEAFPHRTGRTEFVPVRLVDCTIEGRPFVVRSGRGGSANLKSLADADGFAEIPSDAADVAPGDGMRFHPFCAGGW